MVEGQDTGSGVSQKARPQQAEAAIRFYCTAATDNFQHTQNPLVVSFCFCLMSSDAKSILGTIYKVSLS